MKPGLRLLIAAAVALAVAGVGSAQPGHAGSGPTTTASIFPTGPTGSNGWYRVAAGDPSHPYPIVTLNASDSSPGGGTITTWYSVSYGNHNTCSPTNQGACTLYNGPFEIYDGAYWIVYFWSQDSNGTEQQKHFSNTPLGINVDDTIPSCTASASPSALALNSGWNRVNVTLSLTYGNVSGAWKTALSSITGGNYKGWSVGSSPPSTSGQLFAGSSPTIYILTYTITNWAGNSNTCSAQVNVS